MAEIDFNTIFGADSTQTITEWRLNKSNIQAILQANNYEFTPEANNSVDQLMTVIVLLGLIHLTPSYREADTANRNLEFRFDPSVNFDSPTLNGQTFSRHTVEAAFYTLTSVPKINPNNY